MAMVAVFESLPSTINCTAASRPAAHVLGEIAGNHQAHHGLAGVDGADQVVVVVDASAGGESSASRRSG